jgi:hypothetical protein
MNKILTLMEKLKTHPEWGGGVFGDSGNDHNRYEYTYSTYNKGNFITFKFVQNINCLTLRVHKNGLNFRLMQKF